jgi:hypothetical protein
VKNLAEIEAIEKLRARPLKPATEPVVDSSAGDGPEPGPEDGIDTPESLAKPLASPQPVDVPRQTIDPDVLAKEIIDALASKGINASSGTVRAAISSMMTNNADATASDIVRVASNIAVKEAEANIASINQARSTREVVMAEEKVPYMADESVVVTINGWSMRIPKGKTVMVPKSVHAVLVNAENQKKLVKQMEDNAYRRLMRMGPAEDDGDIVEGYGPI